ncbi:MAG TPA: MauE/DoxX family redox-associated membrane protein [Polyangia bacterium]
MNGKALVWIGFAARLIVGALFVVAGALKLGDPTAFATEIANYHLLPELAPWLAVTLPPTELVVGAALLAAPWRWRRAASLAAMGLLVMFLVAIVHVVRAGINVDCGCFGGNSGPVTAWTAARDLVLLALAALAFRGTKEYVTK